VDGQRFSLGDVNDPFTMQSCSKPFTYGICLNELGSDLVHNYIGHEPSGQDFNSILLDKNDKPHNPMLNSGAIITASLLINSLKKEMSLDEKFDHLKSYLKRIAGGEFVGFNKSVFLSELEANDRNYAMGYYMKEKRCFPNDEKEQFENAMKLYFQSCAIEVNTDSLAVMGATLANGGICPTTSEKVLGRSNCVRDVLSLMFSCGMYNYSGEFAFKVGLPAKSGVSGGLILVIPNLMGIALWSPPLDNKGNSPRCLQFCEELVNMFNFHDFDNLNYSEKKIDPRRNKHDIASFHITTLLFAAKAGDISAFKRLHLQGVDMEKADYDGRTALHLAAAEGHFELVKYLVEVVKVNPLPMDRWNSTPHNDAKRSNNIEVFEYLKTMS
jgi:glutaminase